MIKIFMIMFFSIMANANLYDYSFNNFEGKEFKFSDLKGKPFMIVNIATRCGYTPQLEDLEKLHKKYSAKGFTVIGIPSNDFGSQTPEENVKVGDFCKKNFGVSFPILEKTIVTGRKTNPLFQELSKANANQEIKWNFEKFIINKKGEMIKHFDSKVKPLDAELVKAVESILN